MRNAKIITASIMLAALAGLAGCSDKTKQAEAVNKQFMQQGNGTIRRPGQSGFQQCGQIGGGNAKSAAPAGSSGN